MASGHLAEATVHIQQQLDRVVLHDNIVAGATVYDAATLLAANGDPILAATLWTAADRILQSAGSDTTVMPFAAQLRARREPHAQAALADPAVWQAAQSVGAGLSIAEAVALARRGIRDVRARTISGLSPVVNLFAPQTRVT